jgi:hypothetical protein
MGWLDELISLGKTGVEMVGGPYSAIANAVGTALQWQAQQRARKAAADRIRANQYLQAQVQGQIDRRLADTTQQLGATRQAAALDAQTEQLVPRFTGNIEPAGAYIQGQDRMPATVADSTAAAVAAEMDRGRARAARLARLAAYDNVSDQNRYAKAGLSTDMNRLMGQSAGYSAATQTGLEAAPLAGSGMMLGADIANGMASILAAARQRGRR